jgi:hypothetical protein
VATTQQATPQNPGQSLFLRLELYLALLADRENAEKEKSLGLDELSRQVHEIKPHFSESQVLNIAQLLAKDKLLQERSVF